MFVLPDFLKRKLRHRCPCRRNRGCWRPAPGHSFSREMTSPLLCSTPSQAAPSPNGGSHQTQRCCGPLQGPCRAPPVQASPSAGRGAAGTGLLAGCWLGAQQTVGRAGRGSSAQLGTASLPHWATTSVGDMAGCCPAQLQPWLCRGSLS